jgi:hypothetical protein
MSSIVTAEVAQLSLDETTPKDAPAAEDAGKQKGGKKSAKSRSPSAKKKPEGGGAGAKSKSPKGGKGKGGKKDGKEDNTPQSVTVELSEEEKAKKSAKDKIKKEYLAALKNEGMSGRGLYRCPNYTS